MSKRRKYIIGTQAFDDRLRHLRHSRIIALTNMMQSAIESLESYNEFSSLTHLEI